MSRQNSLSARGRANRVLASVAAIAIVASGALGVTGGWVPAAHAFPQAASSPPGTAVHDEARGQPPVSFADVVEKVKPAVVAVRVKVEPKPAEDSVATQDVRKLPPQLRELFRRFGENTRPQSGVVLGSGFFVSADGYVVTNNHVVEQSGTVQVVTDEGRTVEAMVVGTDPKTDLAVLKVSEGDSWPFVRLADHAPRVGDWIVAIGNPFGLGGTVTAGIVSARGRDIGGSPYEDFLQIDAPINKGNSGGPSFNLDGEVVGVNTSIYSPSGGSVGLAFAIPSETVQPVVAQLERDGKVLRGYLGVQVQSLSSDLAEGLGLRSEKGTLVGGVQEGSPAAKAGLEAGDVITSVNGEAVADARELSRKIAAVAPGTRVEVTYVRNRRPQTMAVQVGTQPDEKAERGVDHPDVVPQLGVSLAPASSVPDAGDKGVVVVEVDPSGPAAAKGIGPGDLILEVAGHTVSTPKDVNSDLATARSQGKRLVLVRIKGQQGTRLVAVGVGGFG